MAPMGVSKEEVSGQFIRRTYSTSSFHQSLHGDTAHYQHERLSGQLNQVLMLTRNDRILPPRRLLWYKILDNSVGGLKGHPFWRHFPQNETETAKHSPAAKSKILSETG